jgi:hypothetical protein
MRALIWTKHPGDLLGEAIDFLTHGNAQHFGFLRLDGVTVHEAYFPKVRDRLLLDSEKPFVRKFRLEGMTGYLDVKFEEYFDKQIKLGVEYSVADLFRYQLNIPFPSDKSTICSVYGMNCIWSVAPSLLPLVRCLPDQVSPRDHLISPRWVEEPL